MMKYCPWLRYLAFSKFTWGFLMFSGFYVVLLCPIILVISLLHICSKFLLIKRFMFMYLFISSSDGTNDTQED